MDVLGFELLHKVANVDGDVHHEQVGTAAGTNTARACVMCSA
jgi:hypothetical protein